MTKKELNQIIIETIKEVDDSPNLEKRRKQNYEDTINKTFNSIKNKIEVTNDKVFDYKLNNVADDLVNDVSIFSYLKNFVFHNYNPVTKYMMKNKIKDDLKIKFQTI